MPRAIQTLGVSLALSAFALLVSAQEPKKPAPTGYDDTPLIPGTEWHIHDGKRPRPKVVDPGTAVPSEKPGRAPADAIVLFDGTDLSKWKHNDGKPASWKVANGYMEVVAKTGEIATREEFGDCQLHVEFATPPPVGNSQERGNSGVFLMGLYEIQVLDSWDNLTYADGQAGAVYGQTPPLVNASRKPGEWQAYDITFIAPRFKDGKLESPAYVTVFHNGVLVQNHTQILGTTRHRVAASYEPHGPKASLKLQDHGNPMHFRNIWIRPLQLKP